MEAPSASIRRCGDGGGVQNHPVNSAEVFYFARLHKIKKVSFESLSKGYVETVNYLS